MTRRFLTLPAALLALPLAAPSQAATLTWTNGDGGNSNINNAGNWLPSAAPTDDDVLIFDDAGVGDPKWNATLAPALRVTDGGFTFDVVSRMYINDDATTPADIALDYSTPSLGLLTFNTTNSSNGRFGVTGSPGATWNIGSGNTVYVTGVGRTEFNQDVEKLGDGLLVFDTAQSNGNRGVAVNGGTLLLNHTSTRGRNTSWSVAAGATLGGNGTVRNDGQNGIQVDGTLSPGGDGTYGSVIGTFAAELTNDTASNNDIKMNDGSILAIDFGTAGETDLLDITDGRLDLDDAGNTLSIMGPIAPLPGNYTIVQGLNTGTFEEVLYNGSSVLTDPLFTVNYNPNDITVSIIPEPASIALLGAGALLIAGRRRRASSRV
jgi:hypothetical protein